MLFTHTRSEWLASLLGKVRFHSTEAVTFGIATTIAPRSLPVDLTMNEEQKTPDSTPARASTADLLSVLANPIRLEILAAIAKAEKSVSDIAQELQLDASTVSHSLSLLSEKHLVQHTPVAKRHIYRLSNAVEASVDGPIVRFVVTTDAGEHFTFETRDR